MIFKKQYTDNQKAARAEAALISTRIFRVLRDRNEVYLKPRVYLSQEAIYILRSVGYKQIQGAEKPLPQGIGKSETAVKLLQMRLFKEAVV